MFKYLINFEYLIIKKIIKIKNNSKSTVIIKKKIF